MKLKLELSRWGIGRYTGANKAKRVLAVNVSWAS